MTWLAQLTGDEIVRISNLNNGAALLRNLRVDDQVKFHGLFVHNLFQG